MQASKATYSHRPLVKSIAVLISGCYKSRLFEVKSPRLVIYLPTFVPGDSSVSTTLSAYYYIASAGGSETLESSRLVVCVI